MLLPDKREQKINEICEYGELQEFKEFVALAVDTAFLNKNSISIYTNRNIDLNIKGPTHTKDNKIILPIWNMTKGLPFLWALFHEVGHAMDKSSITKKYDLTREEFAWDKASELLIPFFQKHGHRELFDSRVSYCMNEYKKAIASENSKD